MKELGFEQGVTATLELLLEEHSGSRQQIRELAELLFQCINQVEQMVKIGSGMQEKIETMQRLMRQGDEGDAKH